MSKNLSSNKEISIKSMTGYGKARNLESGIELTIEIRTLNSRFLDIYFKLPKMYQEFEAKLKEIILKDIKRGRVEVYIQRLQLQESVNNFKMQQAIFDGYFKTYLKLAEQSNCLTDDFKQRALLQIMNKPEVLVIDESGNDYSSELQLLNKTLNEACQNVISMRKTEGIVLYQHITELSLELNNLKNVIASEKHNSIDQISEKLKSKLDLYLKDGQLDPVRLNQEAAIIADRSDITEELTRLDSHLAQWQTLLTQSSQGKKMDFLLQEFNREFNTIASKAQNSKIQSLVVDAKVCIEKIKEQVANIE
jgi:uncharacterized protein (TIGR00255 family)